MFEWGKTGLEGWQIQVVSLRNGFVVEETKRIYYPESLQLNYIKKFDDEFGVVERRVKMLKPGEYIYIEDSHNPEIVVRVGFSSDKAKIWNEEETADVEVSVEEGKRFLLELLASLKKQAKDACRKRKSFWEIG